MSTVTFSAHDLKHMERNFRRELINSVAGFKSANLIGTADENGRTNLAVFNSVVHVGANPPYLGFVLRPLTVPRHTFDNIKAIGHYTMNAVHADFVEKAHQTSANYDEGTSEFEVCGLTPFYTKAHPAPYVTESHIRIGLKFTEQHLIKANNTIFMVGEVIEVMVDESILDEDGFVALEAANTVASVGLDAYYQPKRLTRLPYARAEGKLAQ
ncbi:NADH-FMN oxidoreductase RutF, flavin reductase (DIM6/NTAB) family [Catalinimonas alkaloidigena]|uniref:NADH-FMN oxidoreductase RutF, flavin reductase (DIM6/NTAB) family n=1 Tax=Catalinimonas alkaloidigena TaxID=1075417 RepID=A0A1G9BD98_9BACT|nr:flavin reductase [Catalinimonas alkaloidigena]SDK37463.1 NADH-FMN oxidoreductase RutF, flavin reductase (DIM6/NTAB) family [Catalinimonas alkaloidigena]